MYVVETNDSPCSLDISCSTTCTVSTDCNKTFDWLESSGITFCST